MTLGELLIFTGIHTLTTFEKANYQSVCGMGVLGPDQSATRRLVNMARAVTVGLQLLETPTPADFFDGKISVNK